MAKRILIEDIKIDRELEPGDDLSDLSEDHLIDPVVVQGNVLIDGLRRIKLAVSLGIEDILAEEPQTIEEASAVLAWNHRLQRPSWKRILEIHPYMAELIQQRLRRIRSEQAAGRTKFEAWDPNRVRVTPSRDLLSAAYGGVKSHQWERLVALSNEGRRDLLEQIFEGAISPAAAYVQARDTRNPFRGSATDATEQWEILNASVQAMRVTITAIRGIATPVTIPAERITSVLPDYYKVRASLSKIIHQLEEAVGK